ncbi:MAG: hypothetical protein VX288_00230 [Planctomycetota bacterium]|nr:hypothetical protein [Planctomycetota bacterium]
MISGSVDLARESIFITSQVKLHPCLENIEDVVIGDTRAVNGSSCDDQGSTLPGFSRQGQ